MKNLILVFSVINCIFLPINFLMMSSLHLILYISHYSVFKVHVFLFYPVWGPRKVLRLFGERSSNETCERKALTFLELSRVRYDVVGLGRLELPTSRLSGVRSNLLSYRPIKQT